MENASKALIIAGAILLAILIISLGIMIYNQAASVMDSNAMDEVAVSAFNDKFLQYEGDNVKGSNVNALLQRIAQNNLANKSDDSKRITVTVTAGNWSTGTKPNKKIEKVETKALTGKSYKITTTTDSKSGYITTVTIEDAE